MDRLLQQFIRALRRIGRARIASGCHNALSRRGQNLIFISVQVLIKAVLQFDEILKVR